MNEKQAIEIIKAALDQANSEGVFKNLDAAYTVVQAYNKLFEMIQKKHETNEPTNG